VLQSVNVATVVFGVGYIGSALVQDLLFQGREVVGVDNFFSTDRRAIEGFLLSPTFRFLEGSIVDSKTIDDAIDVAGDGVDEIYVLAAQASAHPEAATAEYTEETNLRGPRVILEAARRRCPTVRIIYASSTRVYGEALPAFVDENVPFGSFSDLSHLSKCYVEKLLEMHALSSELSCRAVRLGLTYGVSPVMKTNPRFMTAPNLFCAQAATGGKITVRSHNPIALIHVGDAVAALRIAASAPGRSAFSVFNATSDVATVRTVAGIVEQIATERELPVEIEGIDGDGAELSALPVFSSALTNYGFRPRLSLREGIAETLDHFLVRGQ
jgi:nucleoside-diphosphate-sugar epimerase